jgi:ubiquinone/menaquinone biosynthesis C-methylase UbiE
MSETPSTENVQPPGSQPSPAEVASVAADGGKPPPVVPRPLPSVPAPPRPSRNPPGSLPPRSASVPPARVSGRGTVPPSPISQASYELPPNTIDGIAPLTEDRPSTGPLRRRSRRVVKTEDDAPNDQNFSETPPPVAQVAPVLDSFSPQTALPVVPVASPLPPPVEAPIAVKPVEVAPEPPPMPLVDPSEVMEVIQPMRILSIGDDLPPVSVPNPMPPGASVAAAPPEPPIAAIPRVKAKIHDEIPEDGWTPAPPRVAEIASNLASETAQSLTRESPQPPPLPPKEATPPALQVSTPKNVELQYAAADEVADVNAEFDVEPTSKEGAEIEPLEEFEVEAPAASPPATPTASAVSAQKKAPPPLPPKAPPPLKTAPPPPPAAAQKSAPLPEPSRRRQRPWFEDLFDDDFIRTMDRAEPKAIQREVDFIEQCLGLERGATILDLACGTGLHAVELSSREYTVVGYDLSLNMLALAAEEAQGRHQKLNFLQGDMREMNFDQVFDGVYSWSTSFGYFDDEKNFDVLQRMQKALRTGGILVLDIINRDYVAPRQPSMVWFEGDGCVCMDEMQVDFFSSRLKVKRTAMFDDGRSREIDYSIRLYNLHEIGKMMHDADFKVLEVTGHPAHPGVFFGSESPRLIIVAERK